ncbi:MAG: hypothetical protein KAZ71_00380 [Bacteroidia bacterium]|nr:hypothetical protein [Bacteroidia bacterium]
MTIFTNSVPQWISALIVISFFIPIFMIANIIKQGALKANLENDKIKTIPRNVIIFFITYYLYVTIMSFTGIFQVNTLPPKILIFTGIPLTLFYFVFVFRTKLFWEILENVKLSSLVKIHVFRLVGIFFIVGWYYGILPKSFALIGGIGDLFAAVTAIFVAKLIEKKSKNYKTITLIWNIIGFWDIVSVITSAIYITKQAIESNSQGILEMTKFPFCLIPAFAPATIIFIHICIFKKLKMEK